MLKKFVSKIALLILSRPQNRAGAWPLKYSATETLGFSLRSFIFLFLLLIVLQNVYAQEEGYSAMVLNVTGDVSVQREKGKAKVESIDEGEILYPGDIVSTKKASSVVINYIKSGLEETWPEKMKFSVGDAQTKNVPKTVQVKKVEIDLSGWKDYDHMGGQVMQSVQIVEPPDFSEENPKNTNEEKEGQ